MRRGSHAFLALTLVLCASGADAAEKVHSLAPLREGESIHSQSFDIDPSGRFSYQRSIRRTVGFLGLEVRTLEEEEASRLGTAPFQGVQVAAVKEDGPAARAGLLVDDVVVAFRGEPIRSMDQFGFVVEETPPGTTAALTVLRGGPAVEFPPVDGKPEAAAPPPAPPRRELQVVMGGQTRITASRSITRSLQVLDDRARTGLVLAEVTEEVAPLLGAFAPSGSREKGGALLVADILPGGPAFFSAAHRKDLLIEIAGRATPTIAGYREALALARPSSRVGLLLLRSGQQVATELRLEEDATREREFHFPLHLVSVERKPEKKKFSLIWGLLYRSRTSHRITGAEGSEQHQTERSMGLVLNLFSYSSSPRERELRFLWIFPFRFASRSG